MDERSGVTAEEAAGEVVIRIRVRDCDACNGTGLDEDDFTGECFTCCGTGEIEEDDDSEDGDHYDDDDA